MLILIIDEKVAGSETVQELSKERTGVTVFKSPDQRRATRVGGEGTPQVGGVGDAHSNNVVAFRSSNDVGQGAFPNLPNNGLTEIVEDIEARLVFEAMGRTGNNQIRAAELLQITRGALQYKLKKYAKPQAA